jgi:hypothetical protein
MSCFSRLVAAVAVASLFALPARAQDAPARNYPTGCAPQMPGPVPAEAPTIVGGHGPDPRTLFGVNDLVIIGTGTAGNVHVGQRYYLRRVVTSRLVSSPRPIITTGGLRIIAASEATAIGQIDLGCDGIETGDYLEQSSATRQVDNRPAQSDLDFSSPSRVLFGDYGKVSGANGDLMVAELREGVKPGARYAIYRNLQVAGVPLSPVGEAVVVSVSEQNALVRLTRVRDSINSGDLLIPKTR